MGGQHLKHLVNTYEGKDKNYCCRYEFNCQNILRKEGSLKNYVLIQFGLSSIKFVVSMFVSSSYQSDDCIGLTVSKLIKQNLIFLEIIEIMRAKQYLQGRRNKWG